MDSTKIVRPSSLEHLIQVKLGLDNKAPLSSRAFWRKSHNAFLLRLIVLCSAAFQLLFKIYAVVKFQFI